MRFCNRKLSLVRALALVLLTGFVVGSGAEADEPTKTDKQTKERLVKDRLQRLEAAAKRAAVSSPHADRERIERITKAADEYARTVAGENRAKYIEVYEKAVQAGLGHSHAPSPSGADRLFRPSDFEFMGGSLDRTAGPGHRLPAARTIEETRAYQENYDKLMAAARKPGSKIISPALRIVGGEPDTELLFPDCVAVGDSAGFCCTGTLIAENVVVTAGHCFGCVSLDGQVFVGLDINQAGKLYRVKKAVRHPDYGRNGEHNDLTILILTEKVRECPPRPIAPADVVDRATFIRAAGFGHTNLQGDTGFGRRRMVDLPIVTTDCSGADEGFDCDPGKELVAAVRMRDKDTCRGDSGGPIYVQVGDQWLVCGATSRATEVTPQRICGNGGIYARLDKHIDWIRRVAQDEGQATLPQASSKKP